MKQSKFRKNSIRKLLSLVMVLVLSASMLCLSSCGAKDESLTMYIGLGNSAQGYYDNVREGIEKNTGVKINFVFSHTLDTTNAMVNKIQNNDLPSDIVITASKTDNDYCRKSLLDLATYTNLTDYFNSADIERLADKNGAVYQLPFTSRLIGIEYNATLMEEMGWEPPTTFDDMVALKAKADAAGIKFAVSCGVATGHGFNYLFHTMGTDYLIKPEGTTWFNEFQNGKTDVTQFEEKSDYFRRFADAGLFGDIHAEDWLASQQFSEERALFYYNILNDVYSYDGYQYNDNGTIKGASYGTDGKPVVEKKSDGEAVLVDDKYVLYDKNNEAHKGLDRYTIPGAVILHDKYASMPWISEDGNTNCYTEYNNMFIGLNKELLEKGNEDKLEAAVKALEYMLSDEAMDMFSEIYADGIVTTKAYKIKKDRLYYKYAEKITKGYTMPWYYNEFDVDSITNVGGLVNSYLQGDPSVSMNTIIRELEYRNKQQLKGKQDVLVEVKDTLDYEASARLQAIANGMAADKALSESGSSEVVSFALLPYINEVQDISESVSLPVVQERVYAGSLEESKLSSYVNGLTNDVAIIKMKGADINKLTKNGFNSATDYKYEHVFDVVCVGKGDETPSAKKEYLVAIPSQVLGEKSFNEYMKAGSVITKDKEALKVSTLEGLKLFFKGKKTISTDSLNWEK